jgi:hypothetical protein
MTATFDNLKAKLTEQKSLSQDEIDAAIKAHGEMTDEEIMQLEADRLQMEKSQKTETVSIGDYLAALNTLEDEGADKSSDEYKEAEKIVQQYEAGG